MQAETMWSQTLLRLRWWLILGFLFLLPLVIGPSGEAPVAKMVTIHGLTELMLVVTFLRFLELRGWHTPDWWRLNRFEQFLGVFLLALGLATLTSIDRSVSFWGTKDHLLGFVTYLHLGLGAAMIGRTVTSRRQLGQLIGAIALSTAIVSLHGILQYFGHDLAAYRTVTLYDFGTHRRAFATLGNPIHLSSYLLLVIPLVAGGRRLVALTKPTHIWLTGVLSLAILAAFASIAGHPGAATLINLGFLSVLTGLFIWLWLVERASPRALKWIERFSWFMVGVVIVSCLLVRWPYLLGSAQRPLSRFMPQSSAIASRYPNWAMARSALSARPWFGYGPETYQEVYIRFYDKRLAQFEAVESHIDRVHQIGLDWLIAGGWLTFLAYLSFYGLGLKVGWAVIRQPVRPVWQRLLAAGIVYGLLAYLVELWFNFPSHTDTFLFFVSLGLLIQVHRTDFAEATAPRFAGKKQTTFNGHYWGLGGLSICLALGLIWLTAGRFWQSERETHAGIVAIETGQAQPGIQALTAAKRHVPMLVEADIFLSEGLRRVGRYADALDVLHGGEGYHPRDRRYWEEEAQVRLAWAAQDDHQIEPTKTYLSQAIAQTTYRTPFYQDELQLAAIANDRTLAENIRDEASRWAPKSLINWTNELGIVFAQYHHPEVAISLLAPVAPKLSSTKAWFALGYAYFDQKDYPSARAAFQECTTLDPSLLNCWSGRWNVLKATGATDQRDEILAGIEKYNPGLAQQLRQQP